MKHIAGWNFLQMHNALRRTKKMEPAGESEAAADRVASEEKARKDALQAFSKQHSNPASPEEKKPRASTSVPTAKFRYRLQALTLEGTLHLPMRCIVADNETTHRIEQNCKGLVVSPMRLMGKGGASPPWFPWRSP